jgi:hypothetical protein
MSIRDLKIGLGSYFAPPLVTIIVDYALLSREDALNVISMRSPSLRDIQPIGTIRGSEYSRRVSISMYYPRTKPISTRSYWWVAIRIADLLRAREKLSTDLLWIMSRVGAQRFTVLLDTVDKEIAFQIAGDDQN